MAHHRKREAYAQNLARAKAIQEAESKLPEAQANVTRLRTLHSRLCKEFGDSGSVRQQLENAEVYLENLKQILRG